jgi:hypothetical protein
MRHAPLVVLWSVVSAPLAAQAWNTDSALALARRAVERRTVAARDTMLRDYKARAHGFLFFLGQLGEGLSEPPRLVKTDQLELEVYWKAPRLSKQRIVGWRDRADFPTDINYHIDHYGIVQNNFGPFIRIGEGDEVRDVPHPLSPAGLDLYDFALDDTLTIALPARAVQVVTLLARPKDYAAPRVVGTLFLEREAADLVRMSFSFTPTAYLDPLLEDLSIVLDNALWEGRWWLPFRQEIEIRRRATWLDMPARGIIRGRWEVDGYVFNLGLVDRWFAGREITALPKAERDSFPWAQPLEAAIADVAAPVRRNDLERIRDEVRRIAGRRVVSGLRPRRLGVRRVSDLVHANRVEGLALGTGVVWRVGGAGGRLEARAMASYGFADGRAKGAVSVTDASGIEITAYRELRDVADAPVIAPVVNSISAQEFGRDYGDYYLADGARAGWGRGLGPRGQWHLAAGHERIRSVAAHATPAAGTFRPNQPLGDSRVTFARLGVRRKSEGFAVRRDLFLDLTVEGGWIEGEGARGKGEGYGRVAVAGHLLVPLGPTRLLVRAEAGAGSAALPRHRTFVLGGRGTLLGDSFRAWGGRRAALGHLEWRVPVRAFSIGVGQYARIPASVTIAPFVAAGWAGAPPADTPWWRETPRPRVTAGLALECFGAVRIEAGAGLQSRQVVASLDLMRDFWDIL